MFDELNHALQVDTSGIREHRELEGLANRIAEWLATPMYSVADDPSWGHPFYRFWHDPDSPALAMQLEMAIARKLPQDVRDIRLRRVGVAFTEMDRCLIEIAHDAGRYQEEINLREVGNAAV